MDYTTIIFPCVNAALTIVMFLYSNKHNSNDTLERKFKELYDKHHDHLTTDKTEHSDLVGQVNTKEVKLQGEIQLLENKITNLEEKLEQYSNFNKTSLQYFNNLPEKITKLETDVKILEVKVK